MEIENMKNMKISNSYDLLRVDFEQRSQQVIQLSLDRSKFIKLSLLIWGAPLMIGATIFFQTFTPLNSIELLSPVTITSLSFMISCLANCIILSAITGNRNSSNNSAAGMNYIRAIYFHNLESNKCLEIDEKVKEIIGLNDNSLPTFRPVTSGSTDLILIFFGFVNVIYALIGVYMSFFTSTLFIVFSCFIFLVCVISNFIILRKVPIKNALKMP